MPGQTGGWDLRFQLSDTHAYPGCRVKITEEDIADENVVEFSDGVVVAGRGIRKGDMIVLTVGKYRTARGTEVGEKIWVLLPDVAKDSWKIKAKAP